MDPPRNSHGRNLEEINPAFDAEHRDGTLKYNALLGYRRADYVEKTFA